MGPPTSSTSTGHLQARRAGWPRTRSHPCCHRKRHRHREELPMLHRGDGHLCPGPPPRHIAASSRSMCHSSMASSRQPLSRPTTMQRANLGRRTQNTSSTALTPAWPRRPWRAGHAAPPCTRRRPRRHHARGEAPPRIHARMSATAARGPTACSFQTPAGHLRNGGGRRHRGKGRQQRRRRRGDGGRPPLAARVFASGCRTRAIRGRALFKFLFATSKFGYLQDQRD
jgi:hypothetical protein